MSVIEIYGITVLFGVFLKTIRYQNLSRPRCLIFTSDTLARNWKGIERSIIHGVLPQRLANLEHRRLVFFSSSNILNSGGKKVNKALFIYGVVEEGTCAAAV